MTVREDSRHVKRKVSEDEDDGSEVYLETSGVFISTFFLGLSLLLWKFSNYEIFYRYV